MSPSDKASNPRGRRRWLWRAPLLLLAVPLWLAALLGLFLETGLGKRTAAGLLESVLSAPGQQVEIGRLEGSFFGELRIDSVTFSDAAGAWLELDNALLDWNPAALFRGRLAIERLNAERLALARLPPPGPETADEGGPLLPQLPIEIEAKAIAIDRIELAEPVLGEAATLTLDADLLVARARADLDLAVTRRDAAGGFISANLAWEPATNVLHLSLQGQEPEGGVVARLAGLPGLPALDVELKGAGTLADWKGQLRLALGGQDALTADIGLSGDQTQSLSLKGRMTREGTLLVERLSGVEHLAAWAPDGLDLVAAATREGDKVTVSQLSLASAVVSFAGSGSLDGEALQGTGKLSLKDGRPLANLVPDLALASGDFALTVGGTLEQPSATLAFDARQLAYDLAAFEQARGTLDAKSLGGDAFDLTLSLHAVQPQLDDPAPAWVWGDADVTAAGTLAADGAFDLRQLGLQARDLKLAWKGPLHVDALGEIALGDESPQSLSLEGRMPAELSLLAERLSGVEGLAAWAPDGLDVAAVAAREGDKVTVSQLSLASSVFTLKGGGELDGEAVQGKAKLTLADGRPLTLMVPELTIASGDFDLAVDGTLQQPRGTLTFDARQVAYDLVGFEQAQGTLSTQPLDDGALGLALTLHAVKPQLDDPALAWAWGDSDLTVQGTLAADDTFELQQLDLQARDLKLAWNGPLSFGDEDPFAAALASDATQSLSVQGRIPREIALLIEKLSGVAGLAAWAPDGLALDVAAIREGEQVTVSQLSLASNVFTFKGSGALDGEAVQGTGKLTLVDGRPLAALVPDLAIASGDFELTASGTLDQPQATLTFDAQQLGYDLVAFERAQGTLATKPTEDGATDLALTLHAVNPRVDDPSLEWLWGDSDLTAQGTMTADGDLQLRQVDLQARDLKLAWNGPLLLTGDDPFGAAVADDATQSLSVEGRIPREMALLIESLSGIAGLADWAPDGLDLDVAATRAGGKVTVSELSLASSVFTLKGNGALDGEAVQGRAKLTLADGRPLAALVPDLTIASGDFDLAVEGTLEQPRGTLTFDTGRLAYDIAAFDRARGTLTAMPQGGDDVDLALTLHAGNPQLDGPAPPWIWGDGDLSAAGSIDGDGAFTLRRLQLDATDLKLSWDGSLDVDSLAANGHLLFDGRLPELAQLPGAVLDLTLDAGVKSDDLTRSGAATLAGHLKGSGTLPAQAAELLSAGIDFSGGVDLADDGTLKLSAASMRAKDLSIDLDGTLKDRDVDFTYRLAAADLAAFASAFGTEATGGLTLEGTLSGDEKSGYSAAVDLNGRDLVVAGEQIGALSGKLDLNGFPKAPRGHLSLDAPATLYGPMRVTANMTPQDSGGFLLDPVSINLGSTLQLAGTLESAAGGLPLTGTLSGTVQGSPLLAQLAGLELTGRGAVQLKLTAPAGRQDAEYALNLEAGQLFGIAHRGLRLRGSAQDLLGTPRLTAELDGSGVAVGSLVVDSLKATARGALNALEVTVVAAGTSEGEPITVDLAAQVDALAASPAIRLQRLQGKAMAQDFRLLRPTTLHVGDVLRLESTQLQVGETAVTLELTDRAGERQLRASFDPIKAELLAAFLPDYEPSGTLSATLTLTDRGSGATGTIELNGKDLLVQQRGLAVAPQIDVAGTAKLGGGSLATSFQLSGDFGENLLIEATFPFRLSLYTFDVALPSDGKLAGRATWKGEVAKLIDFLPLDNQVLTGQLSIDLRAAGTLSAPQVQGEVSLKKGHYENLVYGTVLKSLTLNLTGQGGELVLQEASASDGRGGTMTLSGSIDLSPLAMKLTMTLRDFAILQRDDLFAAFDGDLTIGPKGGREQVLAGKVTSREVRLDVAARLPNQVTTLDVVMLKDGEPLGPAGDGGLDEAPLPFVLGLDVKVDLPNKIYVHGSGLDSEWGGHLAITGTTEQPIVRGQLTPRRGQFDALGKSFELKDSVITFDGGPTVDPILGIKATADSGDITAIVEVTGRASAPEINFTSNPVLPEDEVLSRVLFGRGTGRISALEAVQLAEALAIFSGASNNKVGVVDRMRAALGLDVLRLDAGDTDDEIGVITAGEYIRKDVFVGVSQGTTAGSTAAKIEYQATDDIVIEGQAGQSSSVGVRWQWDY